MTRAWRTTPATFPTGDFDFDSTPLSGHQFGLRQKLPFPACSRIAEPPRGEGTKLRASRRRPDGSLRKARLSPPGPNSASPSKPSTSPTETSTYFANSPRPPSPLPSREWAPAGCAASAGGTHRTSSGAATARRIDQSGASLACRAARPARRDRPPTHGRSELGATSRRSHRFSQSSARRTRDSRGRRKRVEEARLRIRVAELEGLPDVDLGIGYRVRKSVPATLSTETTSSRPASPCDFPSTAQSGEPRSPNKRRSSAVRKAASRQYEPTRLADSKRTRGARPRVIRRGAARNRARSTGPPVPRSPADRATRSGASISSACSTVRYDYSAPSFDSSALARTNAGPLLHSKPHPGRRSDEFKNRSAHRHCCCRSALPDGGGEEWC